ncbi:hypothetical protein pb186bvf_002601 [Paramecium bursaria]
MNVEHILQQLHPNSQTINLDFRGVDDFSQIYPHLLKFAKLRKLNLQGNKLQTLIDNMQDLQIEELDIINNPFQDINELCKQLKSLPKLQKLNINKELEAQVQKLLPGIRYVNQKEFQTIKQRDLQNFAIQFDFVRGLYQGQQDLQLQTKFDEHVKTILKDLGARQAKENNRYQCRGNVLRAKYGLQELSFIQVIEYISSHDDRVAKILKLIHDEHAQIFKEFCLLVEEFEQQDYEVQFKQTIQKLETKINQYQEEMVEQNHTIEVLQQENSKYLELIIKHSKSDNRVVGVQRQDAEILKERNNTSDILQQSQIQIPHKIIPIIQLKETINEIYESKIKSDIRNYESQQPKETMEQHLYTYLHHKYGLKSMIVEQASSIIQSIKKYSDNDSEVSVFGKILRNECDEEFRIVLIQVKQTICELLKMFLKQKNPFKSTSEIKELVLHKIQNNLNLDEAFEIVQYMYNSEDSTQLRQQLQSKADQKRHIQFSVFLDLVLGFQLFTHDKFLKSFNKAFKSVDKERTGILNEQQLRVLLAKVCDEQDLQRLLKLLDPYHNNQITYSQIVSVLSQDGKNLNILQKI